MHAGGPGGLLGRRRESELTLSDRGSEGGRETGSSRWRDWGSDPAWVLYWKGVGERLKSHPMCSDICAYAGGNVHGADCPCGVEIQQEDYTAQQRPSECGGGALPGGAGGALPLGPPHLHWPCCCLWHPGIALCSALCPALFPAMPCHALPCPACPALAKFYVLPVKVRYSPVFFIPSPCYLSCPMWLCICPVLPC